MRIVIITSALLSFFISTAFGQSTIQILCYDTDANVNDLKSIASSIANSNKNKVVEINIIKYSALKSNTDQGDEWNSGKTSISFKELFSSCITDPCKTSSEDITRYKKANRNKLIICGNLICSNYNVETSILPTANSGDINRKISDEIKLNKRTALNFILILPPKQSQRLAVRFDKTSIQINQGQSVQLNPIVDGDKVDYLWSPSDGLSCTTCPAPQASPTSTKKYTVKVKNTNGCESEPASIEINVDQKSGQNICACSQSDINLKLISENEVNDLIEEMGNDNVYLGYKESNACNKKRLKIFKNTQSDAVFVYEVPFQGTLNECVKTFKWKLYPENDPKSFFESNEKFNLVEDIGRNSGNKYVSNGYYTFLLNLSDPVNKMNWDLETPCTRSENVRMKDIIYMMEITFFDDRGEECGAITVKNLSFANCTIKAY